MEKDRDLRALVACGSGDVSLPSKKKPCAQKSFVARSPIPLSSILEHQIGLSLSVLTILVLLHLLLPESRPITQKFFTLAYYHSKSGRYRIGYEDCYHVMLWIVIFTGARVIFMENAAAVYARWVKIPSAKDRLRFAEQAWVFVYYIVSWSLGMHVMYQSKYWFNLRELWTDWPDLEISGLIKSYYLVQLAFWLQQLAVIHIEERRKDHWQMFTHHIVTVTLLVSSYAYRWTRVGNMILCLMDFVDFILAFAKILRYHRLQHACDCALGVFFVSWLLTRHVLYLMICYSVYADLLDVIAPGCYRARGDGFSGPVAPTSRFSHILSPFKDLEGEICATPVVVGAFLTLLLGLQVILLLWLFVIVQFTYRVLRMGPMEDPRSEEELEEIVACPSVRKEEEPQPIALLEAEQKQSGSTTNEHGRSSKRLGDPARSTGVHLLISKETLNRVGCDTKTTSARSTTR